MNPTTHALLYISELFEQVTCNKEEQPKNLGKQTLEMAQANAQLKCQAIGKQLKQAPQAKEGLINSAADISLST
jgi:hypothetical protein